MYRNVFRHGLSVDQITKGHDFASILTCPTISYSQLLIHFSFSSTQRFGCEQKVVLDHFSKLKLPIRICGTREKGRDFGRLKVCISGVNFFSEYDGMLWTRPY